MCWVRDLHERKFISFQVIEKDYLGTNHPQLKCNFSMFTFMHEFSDGGATKLPALCILWHRAIAQLIGAQYLL